jgi:hypothetical protein
VDDMTFVMKLGDQTSRSASDIASSLKQVEAELRKVELQTMRTELAQARAKGGPKTMADATRELSLALRLQRAELQNQQSALGNHGGAVKKLGEGFQWLGKVAGGALHSIGERIVGLALSAPGLAVAGARFAVDALAFRESTMASYELMLGGADKAKAMFESNLVLAKKTPFETATVVAAMKQIMSAGFDAEEANILFQAVGDVSAASGFNTQIFSQMSLVLSQIKGAQILQGQDLNQAANALSGAGIGRVQIFAQIAKLKGMKPENMVKAMSTGQISSMEAIVGMVNAIKEKSGGSVGGIMMRQSSTLKGLFSTLSSAPMDFFMSMDLDKMTGLNPFKSFITNLVGDEGVLNTATESGKRLQALLENTFNRVFSGLFGGLSGDEGRARLEGAITGMVKGLEALGEGFMKGIEPMKGMLGMLGTGSSDGDKFATSMAAVGRATGSVVTALAAVGGAATWVIDNFSALFDPARNPAHPLNLFDNFELIGERLRYWWQDFQNWLKNLWMDFKEGATNVVKGFTAGIEENLGLPAGAVRTMAQMSVKVVKSALEISSPSRVFEEVGHNVARGYAGGVGDETPQAASAVQRMVARPALAAGSGGGGVTVVLQPGALQVTIQGGDDEDTWQRLAQRLRRDLPALLEDAVVEAGLVGVGGN